MEIVEKWPRSAQNASNPVTHRSVSNFQNFSLNLEVVRCGAAP